MTRGIGLNVGIYIKHINIKERIQEMKKYEKPVLFETDEMAEGVYAASGGDIETNCWTVDARSVQNWNGSHNVFEVHCVHTNTVQHISTETKVTLTFSGLVTDAYAEFPSTYSGSTVEVTRTLHANGYGSGDNVTYKVWVKSTDEATTKGLTCTGAAIQGTKAANVQGVID
jgi:hypothetical protein